MGTVFRDNTLIISAKEFVEFTGVTSLSAGSFRGMTSLVDIALPPNIKSVPNVCFYEDSSITEIVLQEGITTHVYRHNYRGCTSLKVLVLPSSMQQTTMEMCYGCTDLDCVICKAVTPPTANVSIQDMFVRTNSTFRIYVPDESIDSYKSASGWSQYTSRILGKSQLPDEYKKYWT